MLTKKDLASIKQLMSEQINGVKGEVNGLKGEINGLKGEVNGLKGEVNGLKDRVDGLESQISDLKDEMAEVKKDMVTKEEFNELKQEVYEWRNYSHNKFIIIENEVIPKISALYEMTDFYVKQMECRKYREQTDKKLECIAPLKAVVEAHGERLAKHNDTLERLITGAV